MSKIIELRDVSKVFKISSEVKVDAIKNVSLSIGEGEMVAITGASGSGKSTLLRILGCIIPVTSGTYTFDDKSVNELDQRDLAEIRNDKIGFVFQNFELIDYYTVYENVGLPILLSRKNTTRKIKNKNIMELLDRLGISELKSRKCAKISGGQKQRVAIARALINEPDVILADEPTGSLDTENGKAVFSILQEINKNGKTVIFVTHNEELASLSPRRITIQDGEIVSDVLQTN